MVTHESYRRAGPNGTLALSGGGRVRQPGRQRASHRDDRRAGDGRPRRGDEQVEAQHRRSRARSSTRYGADTARWFILSDNPPERDMEWTEAGVAGAFRFTQRLFRLVGERWPAPRRQPSRTLRRARALALRRVTHRTIAAVTEALESFAFNVAVARLYELANAIADAERARPETGARLGAARGGGDARPADRADDAASGGGDVRAAASGRVRALVAELPWPEAGSGAAGGRDA